jgi:hypothetical protein
MTLCERTLALTQPAFGQMRALTRGAMSKCCALLRKDTTSFIANSFLWKHSAPPISRRCNRPCSCNRRRVIAVAVRAVQRSVSESSPTTCQLSTTPPPAAPAVPQLSRGHHTTTPRHAHPWTPCANVHGRRSFTESATPSAAPAGAAAAGSQASTGAGPAIRREHARRRLAPALPAAAVWQQG